MNKHINNVNAKVDKEINKLNFTGNRSTTILPPRPTLPLHRYFRGREEEEFEVSGILSSSSC